MKLNELCIELFLVGYNAEDVRMVSNDDNKFVYDTAIADDSTPYTVGLESVMTVEMRRAW